MTAPITDGRLLRGVRTRALIVQALLDLLTEGHLSPTAASIAERAGVSVRSVFQHFEDLEALYADLAAEQATRVEPLIAALDTTGDRSARVAALVAQRWTLYETIRPVRHAIGARAASSPALRRRIEQLSSQLREQVVVQFAEEIETLGTSGPVTIEALDALCSFESWDRMREYQHLSPDEAAHVLRSALARLLDGAASR